MKPHLLYLSPVTPNPVGNGLAMRAFHNLAALANSHDITLLVIPTGLRSSMPCQETRRLCGNIFILAIRPWHDFTLVLRLLLIKMSGMRVPGRHRPFEFRSLSLQRLRAAAGLLKNKTFEIIHVFRLYLYPYAFFLLRDNRGARIQLDLDDFESRVRRGQSELLKENGYQKWSERMLGEAIAYEGIERNWLHRFDRIFTCSEIDRLRLGKAYGNLPIEVLPNVVTSPGPKTPGTAAEPFVFLCIGAFSYFPNADGLDYLCRQVLPLLWEPKGSEFVFHIIGAGVKWRFRLRRIFDHHIRFLGRVSHIDRCYNGVGAALVPIRTGGGTRIKVIEAIAHRVPVVSTSKGIEGLKLEPGVDVLVGDTPREMAENCRALLTQKDLRERLQANAFAVFQKYYMPENLRPLLAESILPGKDRARLP